MRSMALKQIATAVNQANGNGVDVRELDGTEVLNCLGCHMPFVHLTKRGIKPNYCRRPECVQLQARLERERNATAKREQASVDRLTHLMGTLYANESVQLRHREMVEVAEILKTYVPNRENPRQELRRFVVAAARAKGIAPWRRALLELAACAIFVASQYGDGLDRNGRKN